MRPDFGDFRAAFFDLAFSFTPSHGNGAEFSIREMLIEKSCATRYLGVCARPTHKNK